MIMMGLRLKIGVDRRSFMHRLGIDLNDTLDFSAVRRLENAGLIVNDVVGLRLSARGRLILDSVLAQLVP